MVMMDKMEEKNAITKNQRLYVWAEEGNPRKAFL
jgi:hypothetical protein